MVYFNDEVPKYKKKVNKAVTKSKHKHTYKSCLLKDKSRLGKYSIGEYCTICGKIGNIKFFDTVSLEDSKYSRVLSNDELLKKYSHYEIKEVADILKTKKVEV